jgi:MFS family permease
MVDGLRFVWNLNVLRTLALIDLTMTALYLPMESVLFPKYFTDRHEPAHLGWVLVALSIGGLAGALAYPLLIRGVSRRWTLLTATLTLGVCTALISTLPPLPVILLLCALIGLVYGPIAPIYNYVMQSKSPPQLRGRVGGSADRCRRAPDDVPGAGHSDDRHRLGVASAFLAAGVGRAAASVGSLTWAPMCWPAWLPSCRRGWWSPTLR